MKTLRVSIVGLLLLLGVQGAFARADSMTLTPKLANFSQVSVSGGWDIVVKKGKEYNVQLIVPNNVVDRLNVITQGKVLYLGLKSHYGWFDSDDKTLRAVVTMPMLTRLHVSGQTHMTFNGFVSKDFNLDASGESELVGKNNKIINLFLSVSGQTDVNLEKSSVTNVTVSVSGESDIKLNMAGGSLIGNLSGESSVSYLGSISHQQINISGESTVEKNG